MKTISVFDTTISDFNLGNEIIMQSVYRELTSLFPEDFFFKLPFVEITDHTLKYLEGSDYVFFGGTNSLSGRIEKYTQWGLTKGNYRRIRNVILLGMGWLQYEEGISSFTARVYRSVLSHSHYQSVRDSYTEKKLRDMGFEKVLNTGCPSIWPLTEEHCSRIPKSKARDAVIVLTDYNKNRERDGKLCEVVAGLYGRVYCWIQGRGDFGYVSEIAPGVRLVSPRVAEYERFLAASDVDYIGTRLHAGIKALQFGKRSIIVGIDNRASEMHKDFNLPVLEAERIGELEQTIQSAFATEVVTPRDKIMQWRMQFS